MYEPLCLPALCIMVPTACLLSPASPLPACLLATCLSFVCCPLPVCLSAVCRPASYLPTACLYAGVGLLLVFLHLLDFAGPESACPPKTCQPAAPCLSACRLCVSACVNVSLLSVCLLACMSAYRSGCPPSVGVSACCLCVCQLSVCLPVIFVSACCCRCVCLLSVCLPAIYVFACCPASVYKSAICNCLLFVSSWEPAICPCILMFMPDLEFSLAPLACCSIVKTYSRVDKLRHRQKFFQNFADFFQCFRIMKSFAWRLW